MQAPADCTSARALLAELDAQLGSAFETDTRLRAQVRVRELGPSDFELRLRYETGSGAHEERVFRGESCAAVSDAAALLLAIVLDPRAPRPEPAPAVPAAPPPEALAVAPSAGRGLLSARTGVLGVLDTGLLRRPALGLGAIVGLRIGPLELRVRGQWFFPRELARAQTQTTFAVWSVDLGVCVPLPVGPLRLGPCARAEVGRLSGSVQGQVSDASPAAARVQALGLGGELRVPLGQPLWLALGADFTWFTRRPQFVVSDLGEVGQPAKFGLRAYLGPLLAW